MKNLARIPASSREAAPEKRRSPRTRLVTRLELSWHTGDGTYICETAETQEVSLHGALLRMKCPLPLREVVALRRGSVTNWTLGRVLRCHPEGPGGWNQVVVELAAPDNIFWGKAA